MSDQNALAVHDPVEQLARLKGVPASFDRCVSRNSPVSPGPARGTGSCGAPGALSTHLTDGSAAVQSDANTASAVSFRCSALTQRCSVLLTVEQQMHLAGAAGNPPPQGPCRSPDAAEPQDAAEQAHAPAEPALSMSRPCQAPQTGLPAPGSPRAVWIQRGQGGDGSERPGLSPTAPMDATSGNRESEHPDLDVLRSLFELAGEALQHHSDAAAVKRRRKSSG